MSNEQSVAYHLVSGFRVEWEYESDRKMAIADVANALQAAYNSGRRDEAMVNG